MPLSSECVLLAYLKACRLLCDSEGLSQAVFVINRNRNVDLKVQICVFVFLLDFQPHLFKKKKHQAGNQTLHN